jgi:hypothetical protein
MNHFSVPFQNIPESINSFKKVKFVPFCTKEVHRAKQVQFHSFLTSTLVGDERFVYVPATSQPVWALPIKGKSLASASIRTLDRASLSAVTIPAHFKAP